MKCKNVGTLETLARHMEEQFLIPVRVKKSKKYETFYKCLKNSLEHSNLGPNPYKFLARMRWWKYSVFNIGFAIVKWSESYNKYFGRRISITIKCFIFFSFFLFEPVSKIVASQCHVLPMFLASTYSWISLFTENVTGYCIFRYRVRKRDF